MAVYKGILYAAGYFTDTFGGIPNWNIAQWDGTSWSRVPALYSTDITNNNGVYGVYGNVQALFADNDHLYIGGSFIIDGILVSPTNLARYTRYSSTRDTIEALYDTLGGTGSISMSNHTNTAVLSMTEYDSKLYVGGIFDSAGHISVQNNSARWSAAAH